MAMQDGNIANWPQDQEHPLLNTVVLKQVFEYLQPSSASLDSLKSVRQVCKVWRDESLGLWRQTAVLNLTPEMMRDPELATMTKLLEQKPFQKYKLEDAIINIPDCFEEGTQANRFWNTVGPHVKHLILEHVNLQCTEFLKPVYKPVQAFMQFLIEKLPNLITLDFQETVLDIPRLIGYCENDKNIFELQHPSLVTVTLDFLLARYLGFSNFPNLQHLALHSSDSLYRMVRNQQWFKFMSMEEVELVYSNLKVLELVLFEGTCFKPLGHRDRLDWLDELDFPSLERFSLDFRHARHNSGFRFLPEFLTKHCEKLKILEVNCKPYVQPYPNFPFDCQLDQLIELRLWGNVVQDLNFLKWTPKLKVLHMDPYGMEKQDVPEPILRGNKYPLMHDIVETAVDGGDMEGVVLHDLEYLQINCRLLSLRSLEMLGEWMPNLKSFRLRAGLGTGSIAVICNQWPLLEHLVGMHGSILTDEDIIGNNEEGLEKKGLVDLAELKTFHLNAACDEGRLTDRVVDLAFLKMSKLANLQICVSDKFTLEVEKLLKDCILNVVVIRNYAGNEEHRNWECCKNKDLMEPFRGPRFNGSDSDSTTETESEEDDADNDEYYFHRRNHGINWFSDEDETESDDEDEQLEEEEEMAEHNDGEEEEKSQDESGDDTEEESKGVDAQGNMELDC